MTVPFADFLALSAAFVAEAESLSPDFPKIRISPCESEHDPKMVEFRVKENGVYINH